MALQRPDRPYYDSQDWAVAHARERADAAFGILIITGLVLLLEAAMITAPAFVRSAPTYWPLGSVWASLVGLGLVMAGLFWVRLVGMSAEAPKSLFAWCLHLALLLGGVAAVVLFFSGLARGMGDRAFVGSALALACGGVCFAVSVAYHDFW